MNKLRQTAKEYDEPFVDVVKGYAEMGYSRRATAQILGYNLPYFRQLCARFNLHRHFKLQKDMRRECRKTTGAGGWPKGKKRNRPPKYSDKDILAQVRIYNDRNLFMAMADIHIVTVTRRFGSFAKALKLARKIKKSL